MTGVEHKCSYAVRDMKPVPPGWDVHIKTKNNVNTPMITPLLGWVELICIEREGHNRWFHYDPEPVYEPMINDDDSHFRPISEVFFTFEILEVYVEVAEGRE